MKLDEIEESMKEVAKFYLSQGGVINVQYITHPSTKRLQRC